MTTSKRSGSRVERLRRLDCCTVSDAMDRLRLPGFVDGLAALTVPTRIAGRVITVKLGVGEAAGGPPRHLCTHAVEQADGDDVIVIEQRSGVVAGSWGGLLTLAAKLRGIAGVVSDGLVRDADEAAALGFPIYARGCTARTARGRIVELDSNVRVRIGEMEVDPGDYVVADRSGVVFVSERDIDAVLAEAEAIMTKEAEMVAALHARIPVSRVMGGNYERLLEE